MSSVHMPITLQTTTDPAASQPQERTPITGPGEPSGRCTQGAGAPPGPVKSWCCRSADDWTKKGTREGTSDSCAGDSVPGTVLLDRFTSRIEEIPMTMSSTAPSAVSETARDQHRIPTVWLARTALIAPAGFAALVALTDVLQYGWLVSIGERPWGTSPVSVNTWGPWGFLQVLAFF